MTFAGDMLTFEVHLEANHSVNMSVSIKFVNSGYLHDNLIMGLALFQSGESCLCPFQHDFRYQNFRTSMCALAYTFEEALGT